MCLIIASETGAMPERDLLVRAHEGNRDGWGIVWLERGKPVTRKGFALNAALDAAKQAEGNPYILHFRLSTHGTVSVENCHPFKVTKGLYMAHNGILSLVPSDPSRSDTFALVEELLRIGIKPSWIADKDWLKQMSDYVGLRNKLAFLSSDYGLSIVNEDCGRWHGDYWLSNEYSTLPSWSAWPHWSLPSWTKAAAADDGEILTDAACEYCCVPLSEEEVDNCWQSEEMLCADCLDWAKRCSVEWDMEGNYAGS